MALAAAHELLSPAANLQAWSALDPSASPICQGAWAPMFLTLLPPKSQLPQVSHRQLQAGLHLQFQQHTVSASARTTTSAARQVWPHLTSPRSLAAALPPVPPGIAEGPASPCSATVSLRGTSTPMAIMPTESRSTWCSLTTAQRTRHAGCFLPTMRACAGMPDIPSQLYIQDAMQELPRV